MLYEYMDNALPVIINAANARLRYGESVKIKKRDLKALEKKLNLEKIETSLYDYKPPEDVRKLMREAYEELVDQDIEPSPTIANLKAMLESNDKYFRLWFIIYIYDFLSQRIFNVSAIVVVSIKLSAELNNRVVE